jgi:N-acetylglucosaminyldiphosphoundecaprenol N-acetyl-beta-D-mannosaminyltransferase
MSGICRILGVPFNNVTPSEAEKLVFGYINDENSKAVVYTPNPEMVMAAQKDAEFMKILNASTLTVPDGIGIVYGSKLTKNPIKQRVAGYDLVQGVFDLMKNTDKTVYFLGGAPGVTDAAKAEMEKKHKGLKVVGTENGYFDDVREKDIIADINAKKPDLLLVGIGFPRQEKWIYNHINELKSVKAAIGVGGSFDVMSGNTKRAPMFFQKFGLEWFYRLITQPTRAGRMLQLPVFMLTVIFKNKRYDKNDK